MKRKPQLELLKKNFLFVEVAARAQAFREKNPHVECISLSVGDTTEPLPLSVARALLKKSEALGTKEGYQGYGLEEGSIDLRDKINTHFYKGAFSQEEIFISDGAICDLGRLMAFFGQGSSIAVQDPTYPGYKDASLLLGARKITLLPCKKENDFFPDLRELKDIDLIFFCSPNNPTGHAATSDQLQELVKTAKRLNAIILYDAAYSHFIEDPTIAKSIFDIPGSREVAIEVHSFSKMIGFTGVRLGFTVVPKQLKYEEGGSINSDWKRFITSIYNGTSCIAQAGGLAALTPSGVIGTQKLIEHYRENTKLLKVTLEKKGYTVYGGRNAPYLWVDCGRDSWEVFDEFLLKKGLIVMPGVGFGEYGSSFIRLTGFGNRDTILKAVKRLENDRMD